MSKNFKIILEPSGRTIETSPGANLLRVLQTNAVPVGSSCGGQGLCASCKVTVLSGMNHLSPAEDQELDLADRNQLGPQERIACQCLVYGPITITTSYW